MEARGAQRRSRRLAVGAAALMVAVAGAAAAYAAGARSEARANHPVISAITAELGISAQELRSDLANGQTLAQIATENGKTQADLEQTIFAAVQSRLAGAVAAGKLKDSGAQALLSHLNGKIGSLTTVAHPVAHLRRALRRAALVRIAKTYLGVTPQTFVADLRSGQTLAQIAAANGKTASGLEQAIETAAKTRLDRAVANGRITAGQEQTALGALQTKLDTLVNHSFGG